VDIGIKKGKGRIGRRKGRSFVARGLRN